MTRFTAPPGKIHRWAILGLILTAGALAWIVSTGATAADSLTTQLNSPKPQDRQITIAVASLLRTGHLSGHALDDEISERTMSTFLKTLDPLKMYFYKSDVDVFMEKKDQLDDLIKRGDISFAYHVFNVLIERINERVKVIDELLQEKPDFAIEEDMVIDPDVAEYPATPAEARDRWRKRIKYDQLVQKADKKSDADAKDRLTRRYHSFAKRLAQTDPNELLEMYLTSLSTAFDPHTSYMSPKTLENFEISMRLELEGIGAALQSLDG